jgi:hypothetical protein
MRTGNRRTSIEPSSARPVPWSRTRVSGANTTTTPSQFPAYLGKRFERKEAGITTEVAQQAVEAMGQMR